MLFLILYLDRSRLSCFTVSSQYSVCIVMLVLSVSLTQVVVSLQSVNHLVEMFPLGPSNSRPKNKTYESYT